MNTALLATCRSAVSLGLIGTTGIAGQVCNTCRKPLNARQWINCEAPPCWSSARPGAASAKAPSR